MKSKARPTEYFNIVKKHNRSTALKYMSKRDRKQVYKTLKEDPRVDCLNLPTANDENVSILHLIFQIPQGYLKQNSISSIILTEQERKAFEKSKS